VPTAAHDLDDASLLRRRRNAIDAIAEELEAAGPGISDEEIDSLLRRALHSEDLEALGSIKGGDDRLVAQSIEQFRAFSPSRASNASSASGMVRILLLQNLDLLWWDDVPDFADDHALRASTELLDLQAERAAGRVRFGFGVAPRGHSGRLRDALLQRLAPRRQPRGPGLRFTEIRPAMLGLLNEIADRAARACPQGTPPIWVTSITRTVEHQEHLRSLGFSALTPSAHCRGWAADIEVSWYSGFGAAEQLKAVLSDYFDAGSLNVIDEGRAWHVCLNPALVDAYAAGPR
jgi:hypothetical protein